MCVDLLKDFFAVDLDDVVACVIGWGMSEPEDFAGYRTDSA